MRDDFFISYKWAKYRKEAVHLSELLRNFGFSVFLDSERLTIAPGERISNDVLKRELESAVRNSNWMVFFESFDAAEIALEVETEMDSELVIEHQVVMERQMTVNGGTIEVPRTKALPKFIQKPRRTVSSTTHTAFNWQEFERTYADRIAYVYCSTMQCVLPGSTESVPFDSIEFVAQLLKQEYKRLMRL